MINKKNTLLVLIITIIVLSVVKIGISNKMSTNGIELGILQTQIASLDTQNYILQQKYLSQASLLTIEQKAKAEGFVPDSNEYFVSLSQHLASTQ